MAYGRSRFVVARCALHISFYVVIVVTAHILHVLHLILIAKNEFRQKFGDRRNYAREPATNDTRTLIDIRNGRKKRKKLTIRKRNEYIDSVRAGIECV